MIVYIIAAYDKETERMTCVQAHTDRERAWTIFGELKIVYGGANVVFASRDLDNVDMGAPITMENL